MSDSSAEDWSELESLIDVLLDAPPERRSELIASFSAGDEKRQLDLERLLAECEREAPLLSRPAAERFAALFDEDVARFPDALAGRYRPERQIARGGMATVYLAKDLKHGRDVAVKVVHPVVASALGADLFLREIEIVAQLRHPHIVPLFDSGDADGSLYYVMPYEPGASLRDQLARDGPPSIENAVVILRDVCDALAYAHQHGVVHRDIKPDNVMLSGRHAMVTDFGVARAATKAAANPDSGAVGLALGTPAYMAPEQISRDAVVDHRVDIYSVGALAYELLTGHPPFVGASRDAVLSAQVNSTPVPVTEQRPDVPASLNDLVMKCLEKKPDDRWQSADEMVERLESAAITGSATDSKAAQSRAMRWLAAAAAVGVIAAIGFVWYRSAESSASWRNRWTASRLERVTDFPGSEVDAAISRDGQLVAFLADRDSVFDAFVTRVGSGRFVNLTNGHFPELLNEDVSNIGFSPDGSHVWIRIADITSPASVSLVPAAGGPMQPFLKTAVMVAWSPDGSRLAYHETTPGDPIYVADRNGANSRLIFPAEPGIHRHYLAWSPDGRFIYFSMGQPPDEMDIWRIPSNGGGPPERITSHHSKVAYPVLLDDRTLFYTATADDGTGPWLYTMDLNDRVPNRVTTAVEHYISIAVAAPLAGKPRRLVATVSNPSVRVWSVPIRDEGRGDGGRGARDGGRGKTKTNGVSDEGAVTAVSLPTARSAAPRFGRDSSLFYLASLGGADGLWKLPGSGGAAHELWKPEKGSVVGAAAVSPDGSSVCFPVRRQTRSTLYCMNADGGEAHPLGEVLDVRGAASWSPDGKWLAVAAKEGTQVRVFKIPTEGGAPVRLVNSVSSNPVWSPDGQFILYSGTPRARSVPLQAVTPGGTPHPLPPLTVDRVGDSYRFLPSGKELVVKLGGFRRQDFWLFDLASGKRRQLTALRPGESLQRFDVSPDGKRIVFERVRENSDIVLIEVPTS